MSILVVGISHQTAPVALLERLSLDADGVEKLIVAVQGTDHVTESTVLSTCNRIEIYTEVERFHGSVESICREFCALADESPDTVVPHLYVHYDDGAISHLFHVAAGLNSMVVGEGQILGQTREALRHGQELGTVGPALNAAFQQALRVAKRTHAETDIDRVAPSLVSVSLDHAEASVGTLAGKAALVVGAGAMASLAVATLTRRGLGEVVVVNRTPARARRLGQQYAARGADLADLADELAAADVVVSCTGAVGTVLSVPQVEQALAARPRRLAVIDLALPHDVEPEVADLPGVDLVNLERLGELTEGEDSLVDVLGVRRIVAEEVQAFLTARRIASVTPTVVALRSMATGVVDAELARLDSRLPDLSPELREELAVAVRRVADKLMHQPTVRVKELAESSGTVSYATALAELFSLDQDAVDAVTRADGVQP
jgi:glutamyl-tRNA reductase